MSFWTTILRGLRLRCPRCGQGRLYRRWFSMNPTCGSCAFNFHPEPGYYVGAMYVNYLATAAIGMTAALLLLERVPLPRLVAGLSAFAILFPIWFFRISRSLWLGFDAYIMDKTVEPIR